MKRETIPFVLALVLTWPCTSMSQPHRDRSSDSGNYLQKSETIPPPDDRFEDLPNPVREKYLPLRLRHLDDLISPRSFQGIKDDVPPFAVPPRYTQDLREPIGDSPESAGGNDSIQASWV